MFSKIITKEIQRRGISFREAAKQIGISHTTLYAIQEGRSMDIETAKAICAWANIPIETLINSEGKRNRMLAAVDVLLRAEPDLEVAFLAAADAVESGELSMDDFNEVIAFAAYMIQRRRDAKKRDTEKPEAPAPVLEGSGRRKKRLSYRLKP